MHSCELYAEMWRARSFSLRDVYDQRMEAMAVEWQTRRPYRMSCFQRRRHPGQKFGNITGESTCTCGWCATHATTQLKLACYKEFEGSNWPESSNVGWLRYESFLDPPVKRFRQHSTGKEEDGKRTRILRDVLTSISFRVNKISSFEQKC